MTVDGAATCRMLLKCMAPATASLPFRPLPVAVRTSASYTSGLPARGFLLAVALIKAPLLSYRRGIYRRTDGRIAVSLNAPHHRAGYTMILSSAVGTAGWRLIDLTGLPRRLYLQWWTGYKRVTTAADRTVCSRCVTYLTWDASTPITTPSCSGRLHINAAGRIHASPSCRTSNASSDYDVSCGCVLRTVLKQMIVRQLRRRNWRMESHRPTGAIVIQNLVIDLPNWGLIAAIIKRRFLCITTCVRFLDPGWELVSDEHRINL